MDYKILKFKSRGLKRISTHYKEGFVKWETDINPEWKNIDEILANNSHDIYQIERSDGVVFTIGDKINTYGTIKTIIVINDEYCFNTIEDSIHWKLSHVPKSYHIDFQTIAYDSLRPGEYEVSDAKKLHDYQRKYIEAVSEMNKHIEAAIGKTEFNQSRRKLLLL